MFCLGRFSVSCIFVCFIEVCCLLLLLVFPFALLRTLSVFVLFSSVVGLSVGVRLFFLLWLLCGARCDVVALLCGVGYLIVSFLLFVVAFFLLACLFLAWFCLLVWPTTVEFLWWSFCVG